MTDAANQTQGAGSRRYQMLDVWRGVICLLVVLEHVGVTLWTGADQGAGWDGWIRMTVMRALTLNIGTSMFFVISGYCIASSLESARRKGITPWEFLLRRAWRIFPTYWVALFGFVALVASLDAMGRPDLHRGPLALELESPSQLTGAQWIGNLTLTETWRPRVWGTHASVYTRVAWSLCYQEQFYAVCCLILWLSPRRLFRGLAVASGFILVARLVAWDSGALHRWDGTFPVRWHEFAVGLAAYWRLTAGLEGPAMGRRAVELGIGALALIGICEGSASNTAAGLFGLSLIASHRWDALLSGLSWMAPLRACGIRSFSIYLSHLPVTVVGNALLYQWGMTDYWVRALISVPLVSAAALALGWFFYASIERRFTGTPALPRLSRRFRSSKPTLLPNPA
ncbi:MAG: acyltransferase family protein [Isosphaeraceae bacterium]